MCFERYDYNEEPIVNKKRNSIDKVIGEVQYIRSINNKLWMDILRVAAEHAPDKTKCLLKDINKNDKKISKLLGEIK